jgi:hypothetical protein
MAHNSIVDDLRYWKDVYAKFGADVSDLVSDRAQVEQYDLDLLEAELEAELERDADHQQTEWLIRDRAIEAIGLVESDGPNIGLGAGIRTDYSPKAKKDSAFINLLKSNRDRIAAHLQSTDLTIEAEAVRDEDIPAVQALNDKKDNILSHAQFESNFQNFVVDGVTYGSGLLRTGYGSNMDSPDLIYYINKMNRGEALTIDEYYGFKRAIMKHEVSYVDTFKMIRYRGARGAAATDFSTKDHRWLHYVDQVPISRLKAMYPEHEDQIAKSMSNVVAKTNPMHPYLNNIEDTGTVIETWVRYVISGSENVPVIDPMGGEPVMMEVPVVRDAIGRIVRIQDVGIVDMTIDEFHHNRFPFVQWNYSISSRHSCGIGVCKYGRDPQVMHNALHNGMLHTFGTMAKGGGFFDSRLGITPSDMKKRAVPGTYVPVDVPAELWGTPMDQLIVDSRPNSFHGVFADLMAIESRAMDEAMSVPNATKGIQQGTSGRQEALLQQQAEQVHSLAIAALERSFYPLAVQVFSNIMQFERDPHTFYVKDSISGSRRRVDVNQPLGYMIQFNEEYGEYDLVPYGVINDITNLQFSISVQTRSIVPTRPAERAHFYSQFFMQTAPFIQDPYARIWLEEMNNSGFRIEGVSKAMRRIEEREQAERAAAEAQAKEQGDMSREQMETQNDIGIANVALKEKELQLKQEQETPA